VVEELERKYPAFPGLNLTWEVREGLVKHVTSYTLAGPDPGFSIRSPSLEAQVANLADEITYYSHDLDDGLDSGLLSESDLGFQVRLWREAAELVRREHPRLPDETRRYFTIRVIIDEQVKDVVRTTENRIRRARIRVADDVRRLPRPLVGYNPERRRLNLQLRKYLHQHLYFNPAVHVPNQRAVRMLEQLFEHYIGHPETMGSGPLGRVDRDGLHRAVCDYLAGMTDRYAIQAHQALFGVRF
jgi:dGTPase